VIEKFIYAIRWSESSPVKIGGSQYPVKRLCDLQVSSPYNLYIAALITAGPAIESSLHYSLAERRLRGEWFDLGKMTDADLLALLESATDSLDDGPVELARLRGLAGLSQAQVALQMGMALSTMNRHEKGMTPLTGIYRRAYAAFYGVEPERIIQTPRIIETPIWVAA
jgi:DNA-binding XRE family transcriptional regulator